MFGFYIGVPSIILPEDEERPIATIGIDGFGDTLSGASRKDFIDAGIVKVFEKYILYDTINEWYNKPIKYNKVKKCLEKIRYTSKIHGTKTLRIDDAIKSAIDKYGEDNLYCIFE